MPNWRAYALNCFSDTHQDAACVWVAVFATILQPSDINGWQKLFSLGALQGNNWEPKALAHLCFCYSSIRKMIDHKNENALQEFDPREPASFLSSWSKRSSLQRVSDIPIIPMGVCTLTWHMQREWQWWREVAEHTKERGAAKQEQHGCSINTITYS